MVRAGASWKRGERVPGSGDHEARWLAGTELAKDGWGSLRGSWGAREEPQARCGREQRWAHPIWSPGTLRRSRGGEGGPEGQVLLWRHVQLLKFPELGFGILTY